jgi:hypothetical protein
MSDQLVAGAATYTHTRETHISALNEIKTRDLSKMAAVDLHLTTHGEEDTRSPDS